MSDLNIALVLKLVDRATAPARAAMKQIEGMGRNMEQIGRDGLAWSKRNMEASERRRKALRGETVQLLAMGAAIYGLTEPAVRFEEQMAQVGKVIDFEAPDGFKQLRNDLFELNTKGGLNLAAREIMAIMEAAGQSNLIDAMLPDEEKRRQLIAFTKDAGIMAVAFDMQAGAAGKAMTTWRNQLKLNQSEALLMGDAVNHLSNNMDANAAAIVNVISRSGALAKTRGLTTNDIAALSAAFVLAAPSPEIAATAMKKFTGVLTSGEAATKAQSAAMNRLGFDTTDMAKRMQGDARGAIMDVMTALSALPIAEQSAALKQLFGEESIGAIAPLLANTDLLARAFSLVSEETKFAGAMTDEFQQITETTAYQRRLLNNQLHRMSVIVGSELLPIMNDMMAVLMPIISGITDWVAANPELVKTIGYVVAGIFAMKAGGLALRWTFEALTLGFIRFDRILSFAALGLGRLMTVIALLGRAVLAHPIMALIAALATGAILIYKNWDGIVEFFTDIMGKVAAVFDIDFFEVGAKMIQSLWDGIGSLIEKMVSWVSAKLEAIVPVWLIEAWTWLKDGGGNVVYDPTAGYTAPNISQTLTRPDKPGLGADTQAYLDGLPARALGGPVRSGFLYEINERGQEFFSPDRDGHVIPAGKVKTALARAGNSLRIGDINIHAAPGMNPLDIARAVRREIERMADAAGSALHDGGAYAD